MAMIVTKPNLFYDYVLKMKFFQFFLAASTVKDKERRSTSRSSFASITDVSSDDEMNVDNI